MSATLRSRAIHGVFWSFLERVGQQGIHFVIVIILARLLVPEQFGLVGMLSVFIEIAKVFINSGFDAALIQRKKATHVDEYSMFYFNILVGFLAAGLLCVISPWVADFYGQPILAPLMCVLSVTLIIHSFAGVQTALLSKRIDFKTQLKVGIASTTLSGAVGIAMAVKGFGVWSLVGQYVASSFFRTALLWYLNTWRPKLVFSFKSLREMFRFGSHLLASSVLNTTFDNIYLVIIGKLFSATHLGLYSGVQKMGNLVARNVTGTVTQVAFPVFSMIQDDPGRLKRSMRKAMATLALFNFPIMVGMAVTARPLIRVLLTDKWVPAVGWLQLLCVAGLLYPFHALHLNMLKAIGHSDLYFRLEVLKKILIVITIAVTYRWGVTGMIWGQIVMSVLGYYINSYYTRRFIHYTLREQLIDLAPYAALSILMALSLYLVRFAALESDALLLLTEVLLGVSLYVALNHMLRLSAFVEMVNATRDRLRFRPAFSFRS
jgi:teichuronic acid exporter